MHSCGVADAGSSRFRFALVPLAGADSEVATQLSIGSRSSLSGVCEKCSPFSLSDYCEYLHTCVYFFDSISESEGEGRCFHPPAVDFSAVCIYMEAGLFLPDPTLPTFLRLHGNQAPGRFRFQEP